MKKLLLLHGAIGSKEQFSSLKEKLGAHFEIHTINFSGHGGCAFEKEFSIAQFAEDTLAYLDQQDIPSIDVFGYSMGGYVALLLAKNHPERIGKICTLGTKFKWNPAIANKETRMLNPEVISEKIPAFAKVLESRHAPEDWKELLAKTAQMMLNMGAKNPLELSDYTGIEHKTKIMLADSDEMVSQEETIEVCKALPNATFCQLENSYHPIEKVDLDLLINELNAFFNHE